MCVVAFGNQLTVLNYRDVTPQERAQAAVLRESLLPELQAGSLIWQLNPIRLINLTANSAAAPTTGLLEASVARTVVKYPTPRILDIVEGLKTVKTGEKISIAHFAEKFLSGTVDILPAIRRKLLDGLAALRDRGSPVREWPEKDAEEEEEEAETQDVGVGGPKDVDEDEVVNVEVREPSLGSS
jgi:hypothetical protein